ncbi:transglycosylase domain-containing protein [Gracilibacillus timonensis]|uniref:transglycosylase domain-containing protein n=1 Tax=Gracilibacillus timonensis TaxID=1816696 RepID=UPI00082476DE|nr:PBP1A family penicillin-binding protein [Gracilibacillus timonensis]
MRRLAKVLFFLLMMMISCFTVLMIACFLLGPPSLDRSQNTIYFSNTEEVIGETSGSEKRYWVELPEIDDKLEKATVWTEDQHFYQHVGFDFKRLLSAIWKDIRTLSLKEGASTITQQYARNLFLTHEKTWKRKLYEAFYTIRLEMFYDKDELLEGYLNTIYYGHGAYGIEAASRHFFDKSANDLSWAEAAMLAGIPNGPSHYSPFHNEKRAKERQEWILKNLNDKGVIDQATYQRSINESLAFANQEENQTAAIAPYFQDVVSHELEELLGVDEEEIRSGGYQVYTTLDAQQQQFLEETAEQVINNQEIQIGGMAMDPESGAITSLIGGQDYQDSSFNRATQAKRMPGSAFKPFLYYNALEGGMTAATALMSKPTTFELQDGKSYQPSNYHDYYANKPITLAQALALSDNIFAVKTNLFVTPEHFAQATKEKFQFTSDLDPVASLALGTEVVTIKEMVTGYSIIANGGEKIHPHTITKVTDGFGTVLYEREKAVEETSGWNILRKKDDKQVLNPSYAYILSDLMKGMFDESLNGYMRVTGASIADELTHEYAGKSGTTNVDNWMVGYSPALAAGFWVGYDDNREIVSTEDQQYAKEVWAKFMEKAHTGHADTHVVKPDNITEAEIDLETGLLAAEGCGPSHTMLFVRGTEPTEYCHKDSEKETIPEDHLLENWWEWLWTGEE